jgi:hypothetical protein
MDIDKTTQSAQSPKTEAAPAFGWTAYAERLNGRFAMIGLVALLLIEVATGQGFIAWLGRH